MERLAEHLFGEADEGMVPAAARQLVRYPR